MVVVNQYQNIISWHLALGPSEPMDCVALVNCQEQGLYSAFIVQNILRCCYHMFLCLEAFES